MLLLRLGKIRNSHALLITNYVLNFSLPCLTIVIISRLDLSGNNLEVAVFAWAVMLSGATIAFLVGRLMKLSGGKLRSFILVTTFPNTAFLGYPLSYAAFGGTGLVQAMIYDQMGMFPIFLTLGFFVAGGKESFASALKFPPFVALLFALFLNVTGISFPDPLNVALKWAGWTTLPLTIFLIGLRITFNRTLNLRYITAALALRMLIIPALFLLVITVMGRKGLPYDVALLESAMPPAMTTSILAAKYKLDEELAVEAISAGTLLCIISFIFFIWFR
ncbi:MAG: AEC family transporter [Deltaproteobacteria bacterium]